ncbi:hypothetical protein [Okeania sp. SIO2C2]|nr:hypothetical protein [Okeania sp. SIO2C2]
MKKLNVLEIDGGGIKSVNSYQLTVPTTEVGGLRADINFQNFS